MMSPEAPVASPLRIRHEALGGTPVIGLEGELDLAGLPVLREVAVDMLRRYPACLLLDLSALSFIDASGVGAVIELRERSVAQKVALQIVPGSRVVHRVFELCRLTHALPFVSPA
jgi:anti-anti-sigma factor